MIRVVLVASLASFVPSVAADAQDPEPAPERASTTRSMVSSSPITFGVFGGAALPSGEYEDDFAAVGTDLGFRVNLRATRRIVGLHADLESLKNGARAGVCADADCSGRILAGFINVDLGLPIPIAVVRPYATAGLGYANVKLQATETSTPVSSGDGTLAWNVGGGVQFTRGSSSGSWGAFVEARFIQLSNVDVGLGPYRNVSGDVSVKPVSVGITFRPCWSCAELEHRAAPRSWGRR